MLAALQYRDRAKERRKQFGNPEPPLPSEHRSSAPKTKSKDREPSNDVSYIESLYNCFFKGHAFRKIIFFYFKLENTESVASKLMRKMGWNEGSGIGKNLQGNLFKISV